MAKGNWPKGLIEDLGEKVGKYLSGKEVSMPSKKKPVKKQPKKGY